VSRWRARFAHALFGSPDATSAPEAPAEAAASELEPVVEALRIVVSEQSDDALPPSAIGAGDHLYDCGHMDSMSAVALLGFIEERYGVTIDEVELAGDLCSLDALARRIVAQRPRGPGSR